MQFIDYDWYKEFCEMDLSDIRRIQVIADYVANEKLSELVHKKS